LTALARVDAPSGEGTVDRRAFLPRPSHIHDRRFHRNADIAPPLRVQGPETFQDAIAQSARMRSGGVIVTSASTTYNYRELLTEQLLRARLPSIAGLREFAEAGGVLSYGINLRAVAMRLAEYVDRILRGATPGDLPVEQPTTFELVINLKAAKALGLTIPRPLLARADQVIE